MNQSRPLCNTGTIVREKCRKKKNLQILEFSAGTSHLVQTNRANECIHVLSFSQKPNSKSFQGLIRT